MIFGDICNGYPISYYLRLFIRHPLRAVFIVRAVSILSVTISDFNQVRVCMRVCVCVHAFPEV